MRITVEEASLAGKLTEKQTHWTDEELKLIIKVEKLVIAFLGGKGQKWHLATSPLIRELSTFEDFVLVRKTLDKW